MISALCKDDANGNVPLGKSCNRYWACQGGYPRLQRCPAMLVFDRVRKGCVNPPTDLCDVPPTTSPPDDDENGDGGDGDGRRKASPNRRRQQDVIGVANAIPFQLPEGRPVGN